MSSHFAEGATGVALRIDGVLRLTMAIGMALAAIACGLDGVRGTVLAVGENQYLIRDDKGTIWKARVDDRSHRDPVQVGDEVRVYIAKDGHAAFVQKLKP